MTKTTLNLICLAEISKMIVRLNVLNFFWQLRCLVVEEASAAIFYIWQRNNFIKAAFFVINNGNITKQIDIIVCYSC